MISVNLRCIILPGLALLVIAGSLPAISGASSSAAWAAERTRSAALARKRSRSSRFRHSIVVMVNDHPITKYNVDQRAALLALQTRIGKQVRSRFASMIRSEKSQQVFRRMQRDVILNNPGKTRAELIKIFRAKQKRYALSLQQQAVRSARRSVLPRMRKKALNELIEESLKIQAAKKINIVISDSTVDEVLKKIAARNKKTPREFAAGLKRLGVSISTMRARMKANFAWRQAIRRRFGALVAINDAQIDDTVAAAGAASSSQNIELLLQRIVLPLPAGNDQAAVARRYAEAELIARRFKSCKKMSRLVKGIKGARFSRLGMRNPNSFPEPTRTTLLSASDNQIIPPILASGGIELYAVCGRRVGRGDDKARARARGDLRQKEFQALANRHMRDLKTDAIICRRIDVSYAMNLPPCS